MSLTKQLSAWRQADVGKELDAIIASTPSPDKIDKESLMNTLSVTKLPNPPVVVPYAGDLENAYISEVDQYLLGKADIDTTIGKIKSSLQKIIDANK